MNIDTKAIRKFRTKMAALLILKKTLTVATVWGLVWGTIIIVLRAPPAPISGCRWSDTCHRLCNRVSVTSNSDANCPPGESRQTQWCWWTDDGGGVRGTG